MRHVAHRGAAGADRQQAHDAGVAQLLQAVGLVVNGVGEEITMLAARPRNLEHHP
jgi:hypothetical protein